MIRISRRFFLPLAFISIGSFAQSITTNKIDVNKDIDIVKIYEQVVLEGYGTPIIYEKLANSYYFRSEYKDAKKWFEKLFEVQESSDEILKQYYRQTVKALGLEFENNP